LPLEATLATYIDHILTPGETVHATARITGWIWFWPVVVSLAILAGLGLALTMPSIRSQPGLALGGWALAAGLVCAVLIGPWIRQSTTNMVVTDRRVIAKFGLIARRAIEMRISKIESIQVDQTLLGRMLNFGTVMVHGTGGAFEPLSPVGDPLAFKRAIEEQVNAFEDAGQREAPQTA
jgi:uncharacterized membrane protein YdbT with pleckstrin-like domain